MQKILNLFLFILIFFSIYALVHYYFFNKLVVGLNFSDPAKTFLKIIFLLGAFSFPVGLFFGRKLGLFNLPIIYIGSLWIGIISIAFSIFLLNDIARIFFKSTNYRYYSTICSLVMLGLTFLYSFYNVQRGPEIKEIIIKNKKTPQNCKFTIVHLSDLHLGSLTSYKWLKNIVNKTNELNPDIIVITGDLIDSDISNSDESIEILKQLKSKYGIFAVTGNHEFYAGIEKFLFIAEKTNIKTLRNQNYLINNSIYIAGVDDEAGKQFGANGNNLELSLKNCGPNKPIILLNHRPLNFEKAVNLGVDLQLSGHTHAGQIPPADLMVMLIYKYPAGGHSYKNSYIYTSSGTGTWGPPLRLFSHSEITKIILEK